MACALVGAIASVIKPECELGQQFVAGIDSIGPIFLPVAGIMASAPYLTAFVSTVFGPAYGALGADPAMAATTFIARLLQHNRIGSRLFAQFSGRFLLWNLMTLYAVAWRCMI